MDDARARLARFIEGASDTVPGLHVLAVGWATVELDRAAEELASALDLPAGAFGPADPDVTLGSFARLAAGAFESSAPERRLALVLLEPSTEGRLAATLARFGEGPVAIWFGGGDVPAATAALHEAQVILAAPRGGPLGPARLLLDGPVTGPHRFLVDPAPGTIAR